MDIKEHKKLERTESVVKDVANYFLKDLEMSEISKKILIADSIRIGKQIKDNIGNNEQWVYGRVALKLACDKNSCALRLKVKNKYLQKGRKISGIKTRLYPEEYLDAQISILKHYNNCIEDDETRIILDKVRTWALQKMKELYENPLETNYIPINISLALIYLGLIKYKTPHTQLTLRQLFNCGEGNIRRISRDLVKHFDFISEEWYKYYHRIEI